MNQYHVEVLRWQTVEVAAEDEVDAARVVRDANNRIVQIVEE